MIFRPFSTCMMLTKEEKSAPPTLRISDERALQIGNPASIMSDSCQTVIDARRLESDRPNLTAFIVCLGCVVVLLDVSIVNVALQRISNGLGGRLSDLQWIVDAYTLAFASFLLTGGT